MRKKYIKIFILIFALNLVFLDTVRAEELSEKLSGRILLQVEGVGQAWYIDPNAKQRAFLGRPADAFRIMKELGLGTSEKDYNSFGNTAPKRLSGKILLRVEAKGEAYYVYPADLKLYYLGRPADAFKIMKELGLGITNANLNKISVYEKYKEVVKAPEPEQEASPAPSPETAPSPEPITVQKPTIEFIANNQEGTISVLIGDEVSFVWNSLNAVSCRFTNEESGEISLFAEADKFNGTTSIASESFGSKTYNYICENSIGAETKTIVVETKPYIVATTNSQTYHGFGTNKLYSNISEFTFKNYKQDKVKINKIKIKLQDFLNNNYTNLTVYLFDNKAGRELQRSCIVSGNMCEVEFDASSENFEISEDGNAAGNDQRTFTLSLNVSGFTWSQTSYYIINYYLTGVEFDNSSQWPANAITDGTYKELSASPLHLGSFEKN